MGEEQKKEGRKLLTPWQRIGALLLDYVMVFFLCLLLDRLAVNPIVKAATPLEELQTSYDVKVAEYQKIEDQYHLYSYTDSSERVKNEEVAESDLEAFMADPQVVVLRTEVPEIQNRLQIIRWSEIAIDVFLGSLIYMLFAYVLFGTGRSFGLMVFKANVTDANGNKIRFKRALLYGFLKWLFLFPLGVLTCFILPIKMLYDLFYKEGVTFLEKKLGLECRILPKYID